MKSPFFSIIIPTFNRANHIVQTVNSVLDQEFKDFELILVDDGSTDNTQDVIMKIKDSRLLCFKKENGERGAARNFGINRSNGRYVTFLDSDDRLYAGFFQSAYEFINKKKQPAFFHSGYEIKNENGSILSKITGREGDLKRELAKGNFLSCIGVFVRRDVIKKHLFNEDYGLVGSEDWELWMRLASRYPLLSTGKVTAFMVQHQGRSVMELDGGKLEKRIKLVWECLKRDEMVCLAFKNQMLEIEANLNLYLGLHLMMGGHKKKAFDVIFKAIQKDFKVLFTKKMLVLFYKGLV